jgi:hypothetical protein
MRYKIFFPAIRAGSIVHGALGSVEIVDHCAETDNRQLALALARHHGGRVIATYPRKRNTA